MKGTLVVIEGIDGCGKKTIAQGVVVRLKEMGHDAIHTEQPSGSSLGRFIRDILEHRTEGLESRLAFQMAFVADRVEHVTREIWTPLQQGKVVVCERYLYSTMAYAAALVGPEWLRKVAQIHDILEVPRPDIAIMLDITVEMAFDRMGKRQRARELFEKFDLQQEIRKQYARIPKLLDGNRQSLYPEFQIMDNGRSAKVGIESALALIQPHLKR
jgi:dTMP kinase